MNNLSIFWLELLVSIFVFSTFTKWYVWPLLQRYPVSSALTPLLAVHVFRYVGMTLLVTDMIDPRLPRGFLADGAYGDLIEAGFAFAAIFALRTGSRVAIPMVWIANLWGFVDLLNGLKSVLQIGVPNFDLATIWYIYTFYAPIVVISHVLIFLVLIKRKTWAK